MLRKFAEKNIEYHCPDSCNKCQGKNTISNEVSEQGHMSECETICEKCGHKDYWAYGYFDSALLIESNCQKYSF